MISSMDFVAEYLQSMRMAQDLGKLNRLVKPGNPDTLEYPINHMTYSLLRWQQLFQNPFVDHRRVKMKAPTMVDFRNFVNDSLYLLKTQPDIRSETLKPMIDELLLDAAQKLLLPGPDFEKRMVVLLTSGVCEYHGFNAAMTESIKKHGLNPKAKFSDIEQIKIVRDIMTKAGKPMGHAVTDHGKVFVSPDPSVAYLHSFMSPEWFYFFSDGGLMINHPYNRRDHDAARRNLLNFDGAETLNADEKKIVVDFFEDCWKIFATPLSPKIAVMPMFRKPEDLEDQIGWNLNFLDMWGYEKTVDSLLNSKMYRDYQHIYTEAIGPEFLKIMDIPTSQQVSQKLTQLRAMSEHTQQSLESQKMALENTIAAEQNQTIMKKHQIALNNLSATQTKVSTPVPAGSKDLAAGMEQN